MPPPPHLRDVVSQGGAPTSERDQEKAQTSSSDSANGTKELDGQKTLGNGNVIDSSSAASLSRTDDDSEEEDDYGYTAHKIQRKYNWFQGALVYVCLNKGTNGLGISLSGHKDRARMNVFVCGMNPQGNAFRDGRMKVGDLILEVNGNVIHNRHHLNVTSLIKGLPDSDVTFVLGRTDDAVENLAVKPLTHFPAELYKDNPLERYRGKYKGLREVNISKGEHQGLGIMIMEGRHSEAGSGVFVSDIQPGSCSDEAGLQRGDMILCVNGEDFVGVNYETAASVLKNAVGMIKLIVANPNPMPVKVTQAPPPALAAAPPVTAQASSPIRDEVATTAADSGAPKGSPEKPKLPPKPAIAPKPAGLSPTHKPNPGANSPSVPATSPQPPATSPAPVSAPQAPKPAEQPKPPAAASRKPVASPRKKPGAHSASDPTNPANCGIVPGADTTIEITKDKDEDGKPMGLGLSIVGGSDTLLGAIFIHEVYEKGAAHKDGRLRPGDQILEVMSENLRSVTHSHALHALRQTPNRVRLVIHREDDEIYETIEVELNKKKDKGLGLSIVGKKSGPGVFISEVVKGGAADSDGRLVQGDQIISVNGHDLTNSSQEEAAPVLKMAQGKIQVGSAQIIMCQTDRLNQLLHICFRCACAVCAWATVGRAATSLPAATPATAACRAIPWSTGRRR